MISVYKWSTMSRRRRWLLALGIVVSVGLAIVLIVRVFFAPSVPDPSTATIDEITDYLTREQITQLDSQQREAFFRKLATRHMQMTDEEQKQFQAAWDDLRSNAAIRRQISMQFRVSLIRQVATQYSELEPEQQGPFLDRTILMIRAMDGPLHRELQRWVGSDPVRDGAQDPQVHTRHVRRFQRDILPVTNARERADIHRFGRDLVHRARSNATRH